MTDKPRLAIGIVGIGRIASTHGSAIKTVDQAALVCACSRNPENLSRFADKFDVKGYRDYQEFLDHEHLAAVSICTPGGTHLEYGKAAAEAGKHVIVEKPVEITVKRGRELIDCCRQNGVKLSVIYQNRFCKAVLKVKQIIDKGRIGKPVMARASVKWFRDSHYYTKSEWRGTLNLDGGGAVINQAIHTLDLLQWFLGEPDTVSAKTRTLTHTGIEGEDCAAAIISFKSGAIALFEASTSITPGQERTIEINGTSGTVLLTGSRIRILTGRDGAGETEDFSADTKFDLHAQQYQNIVHSLLHGGIPQVEGEESLLSLAIVQAIYKSAKTGTEIEPLEFLIPQR